MTRSKVLSVGALFIVGALSLIEPAVARKAKNFEEAILQLGLDPVKVAEPLVITEEIKTWAASKIPRSAPEATQLKLLLDALRSSEDIQFEYQAGYTGTAQEAFTTGKYNCLSFSMLFVSLARSLGLPAYFLNVKQVETYEKQGDLVVLTRHITAGYGFVKDRTILEFDVGPDINYHLAEPISDIEALALFYSNRGTELLREGQGEEARASLEIAVALGPKMAQNLVNLGVVQRRMGFVEEAEASYLAAIEAEAGYGPAYENLAALFRLRGERDAAGEILRLLQRRKNRNPFTYLALGDLNLEEGRVAQAERFYKRALRLARSEPETHAAMGLWALAAGERGKAENWLERAQRLGQGNERLFELQSQLKASGGVPDRPVPKRDDPRQESLPRNR